jgi:3-hydroxybutyryl-CoA dehydrogenase
MKLEDIRSVTVLGAGIMGHGIAQTFIMGGYRVHLYDLKGTILEAATAHIRRNLELLQVMGMLNQAIEAVLQRLTTGTDLRAAVSGSDVVIEAATEDLGLKQQLFREVESFCRDDAIIASNTSSLTLTDIGARVKRKDRLVITHWFNPPHIVPLVEVVQGEKTSDETVETTVALLNRVRKVPVRLNVELPGFLVNRIQAAIAREVLYLYEKGVASAADIDKAVKGSIGFRLASIGMLLTMDLGGLDVWSKVCENLLPAIQSSTKVPRTLEDLTSKGQLGVKSGKGIYDYALDFSKGELDEAIRKRDREFLKRLKEQYWGSE